MARFLIIVFVTTLFCGFCNTAKAQPTEPYQRYQDSMDVERKMDSIEQALYYDYYKLESGEDELEKFLDSVGDVAPKGWIWEASHIEDSIFRNRQELNRTLSQHDFAELKRFFSEDYYFPDSAWVARVFSDYQTDTNSQEGSGFNFISFDKNPTDFNEFAISPNAWGNESDIYFFKSNKIIAKHHVYYKYVFEEGHFKDADGNTVVYYKENYGSGTGIWQFNYYFYKYMGNRLVPALNILENGNLNGWGESRSFWLETFVTKTTPLTLKFVYNAQLFDTAEVINDSAEVQYYWDATTKTFAGDYSKSNISPEQILTYSLSSNELLFINRYYGLLKQSLDKSKPFRRHAVLLYLDKVKNFRPEE